MTKEQAITEIKSFRISIDVIINSIGYLIPGREVSLAHTNLQRAKMWLGKALAELGNPTPYPQSEDSMVKTIEPQADHSNQTLSFSYNGKEVEATQTTRVKHFRYIIQVTIDNLKKFGVEGNSIKTDLFYGVYTMQSTLALEEAKMWLGMELDCIRIVTDPAIHERIPPQDIPLI